MGFWQLGAAVLLVAAAPVAWLQARVNAGESAPQWALAWNGFRLADEARGHLVGEPNNPEAGIVAGADAVALARAAYVREPLASDGIFVLGFQDGPINAAYAATDVTRLGAKLDKRNALLQMALMVDASRRAAFEEMFAHADVLAAANPVVAKNTLAPFLAQLGDPAVLPIIQAGLARDAHWAEAFKSYVPSEKAALQTFLALRRQAPKDATWPSDEKLIGALVGRQMYDEAFAMWRSFTRANSHDFGFAVTERYAPIGWRLAAAGDKFARIDEDGAMRVFVTRGSGGELGRQLLQLSPGRYRLEAAITSDDAELPMWAELRCTNSDRAPQQTFKAVTELVVNETGCPAHWLLIGASALDSGKDVEARISRWRFYKLRN